MKAIAKWVIGALVGSALAGSGPSQVAAQGRGPNLGVGRPSLPAPSRPAPPPTVSSPRSLPSSPNSRADSGSRGNANSRRPGLFQDGVTPSTPGRRPPGSGSGGDRDHHGGRRGYPYYYDPFYDPYFNRGGYGFNPNYGPFGADEYYYYGYNRAPYDRYRSGDERLPDTGQGNVQLRIEPRDVQVFVDGVLSARDGRARLNLPSGRWRLEFVKPGYRTETVDVEVTQGVSVRVERRLIRLEGEEAASPREPIIGETGELRVEVRPDDAIVSLDGRAIGLASDVRSSAALRRLPAGRHRIEVRRPGYATLREEVVVSPVQPAVVRGEMVPEKG